MNADEANALLLRLRTRNSVGSFTLGGVCMWPLFRLAVVYHVIRAASRPTVAPPGSTRTKLVKRIRSMGSGKAQRVDGQYPSHAPADLGNAVGWNLPEPDADLLLVQSYRDFTGLENGFPFDPVAEGLSALGARTATVSLPGHASLASKQSGLSFVQPVPRTPRFTPLEAKQFSLMLRGLADQVRIRTQKQIVRPIDCQSQAIRILSLVSGWISILERLRPRAVMVQNYMNLEKLALGAAARQLGIPLIDHQHGMFMRGAEIYLSWPDVPDGVIDPVPSHFWVWSDWFGERMPQPSRTSTFLVGGDLRRKQPTESEPLNLPPAGRTILYLHQPIGEAETGERAIPPRVADAIQRSPKEWQWLVRLHPRLKERTAEARAELGGITNVVVEDATNGSLEACLDAADVALTGSSAAAFDAIDAGVPTVFMDSVMETRMPGADEHPLIIFAPSDDLVAVLGVPERFAPNPVFVRRDSALANAALAEVLRNPSSRSSLNG